MKKMLVFVFIMAIGVATLLAPVNMQNLFFSYFG